MLTDVGLAFFFCHKKSVYTQKIGGDGVNHLPKGWMDFDKVI
jgi:hypothetical protein